jgi:DNA mismatch endonuclease, patch repair protein
MTSPAPQTRSARDAMKSTTRFDRLTPEQRSKNMSRVKGANTGPELKVRRALHRHGFRFRLHSRNLPGVPDIVLPRFKLAIFVHGCFWHGHEGCKRASVPRTRRDFWLAKLTGTKERDVAAVDALKSLGYKVLVLWECELKDEERLLRTVKSVTGRDRLT